MTHPASSAPPATPKPWATITLEGGLQLDVDVPPEEVVASFIVSMAEASVAARGKPVNLAVQWWTPWAHCTIRLDKVIAICPRRSHQASTQPRSLA